MIAEGVPLAQTFFERKLRMLGSLDLLAQIDADMAAAGLTRSVRLWRLIVQLSASLDEALSVVEQMVQAGRWPDASVINTCVKHAKSLDEIEAVETRIQERRWATDLTVWQSLATARARHQTAREIMDWHDQICAEEPGALEAAMRAFSEADMPDHAITLAIAHPGLPGARQVFARYPDDSQIALGGTNFRTQGISPQRAMTLSVWAAAQSDTPLAARWADLAHEIATQR